MWITNGERGVRKVGGFVSNLSKKKCRVREKGPTRGVRKRESEGVAKKMVFVELKIITIL